MSFPNLHSFGGWRHFGVDTYSSAAALAKINELADGETSLASIRWSNIEPDPPDPPGNHVYSDSGPLVTIANDVRSKGRRLLVTFLAENDWAFDTHPTETYIDPGTGLPVPMWLNIKPANRQDLADVITELVTALQPDSLQVGGEADNAWFEAAGFIEVVDIVSAAAKAAKPGILILAAGFNFGNTFLIDPDFETDARIFTSAFIAGCRSYDVLTLHLNHLRDATPLIVAWVQAQMAANGYGRPIWADDMATGLFASAGPLEETTPPWSSQDELDVRAELDAGDPVDPGAITAYWTDQASELVKKAVTAFAAGIQKVHFSLAVDWASYHIELYRYQGLLTTAGIRKPAFYSAQQLIRAIDGFTSASVVSGTAYKFLFPNKGPVVVAWAAAPGTIDLSSVFSGTVRAITVVTTLTGANLPIYPADWTGAATVVPVDITPVLVAAA